MHLAGTASVAAPTLFKLCSHDRKTISTRRLLDENLTRPRFDIGHAGLGLLARLLRCGRALPEMSCDERSLLRTCGLLWRSSKDIQVEVFWETERRWYMGQVTTEPNKEGKQTVKYHDGAVRRRRSTSSATASVATCS